MNNDEHMIAAEYSNRTVSFNTAAIDIKEPFSLEALSVIFHEIAHEHGHHTEESYHETLALMCAKLLKKAESAGEILFK